MRTHKYVKRTGAPGNYKYWYKLPSGELVEGDQEQGRNEHASRLVHGHVHGHHTMDINGMSKETGLPYGRLNSRLQNARAAHRQGKAHGFEEHHLKEAHKPVGTPEYEAHVNATPAAATGAPRPATTRPTRRPPEPGTPAHGFEARLRDAAPARRAEAAASSEMESAAKDSLKSIARRIGRDEVQSIDVDRSSGEISVDVRARQYFTDRRGEEDDDDPDFTGREQAIKDVKDGLSDSILRNYDINCRNAGEKGWMSITLTPKPAASAGRATPARRRPTTGRAAGDIPETDEAPRARPRAVRGPATRAAAPAESREAKIERIRRELAAAGGPKFGARPEETPAQVRESVQRINKAVSTSSPAAAAVSAADPDFAASEAPVRRMEEASGRGENPYLKDAKDLFTKIKGSLAADRKKTCEHLLNAFAAVSENVNHVTSSVTEGKVIAKYRELSGDTSSSKDINEHFEVATGRTIKEIVTNAPLDIEVERMKRGYAAKQMARLRSYLKPSFLSQNPSAPPPMPTFGDISTWREHSAANPGAVRPAHITDHVKSIHVPKELHDAAVKTPDGKPLYPPSWMPIHLMPVWNYVAKDLGSRSYAARGHAFKPDGSPDLSVTPVHMEGKIIASLRKYVTTRGAGKLVDIPKSKLAAQGLTHADIFKGDMDIKELIKHKIIDPVALQPFIDEELKSMKKSEPSFELVIDVNTPPVTFKKAFTVPVSKAEIVKARIERIRGLLNEKKQSRLS